MNPNEILEELDRLGVTIWHHHLGDRAPGPFSIVAGEAPPELQAEIKRNNDELLKLAAWKPGKSPGMKVRKPRQTRPPST